MLDCKYKYVIRRSTAAAEEVSISETSDFFHEDFLISGYG